jgi:hypothetical protein
VAESTRRGSDIRFDESLRYGTASDGMQIDVFSLTALIQTAHKYDPLPCPPGTWILHNLAQTAWRDVVIGMAWSEEAREIPLLTKDTGKPKRWSVKCLGVCLAQLICHHNPKAGI